MADGPLQATDASGRVVPAQLSRGRPAPHGRRRRGGDLPLRHRPPYHGLQTPAANFSGTAEETLGYSVALSADGQEALVGPSSPTPPTCLPSPPEPGAPPRWRPSEPVRRGLGSSVALSADGQVALVGAPFTSSKTGAAYVYEESAGVMAHQPGGDLGRQLGRGSRLFGGAVGRRPGRAGGAPAASRFGGAAYLYAESAGPGLPPLPASRAAGTRASVLRWRCRPRPVARGRPVRWFRRRRRLPLRRAAGAWPSAPTASFIGTAGEVWALRWRFGRRPGRPGGRPVRQLVRRGRLPLPRVGGGLAHRARGDFHGHRGRDPRHLGGALGRRPGRPGGRPRRPPRRRHRLRLHRVGRGWPSSPAAAFRGGSGEPLGTPWHSRPTARWPWWGQQRRLLRRRRVRLHPARPTSPCRRPFVQGLGPGTHFRTHSRSAFRWVLR